MLGFIIMLQRLGFTPSAPLTIWVDDKTTVDGACSNKVTKDSRHQVFSGPSHTRIRSDHMGHGTSYETPSDKGIVTVLDNGGVEP